MAGSEVSIQIITCTQTNDTHSNSDDDTSLDGENRALRAVPETDDEDDRPNSTDLSVGVDDGFLPANAHEPRPPSSALPKLSDGFVEINGVLTRVPDVNTYQQKKTLAQGMMDLALLSANANQLRYVLEAYKRHPYYYPTLIFISLSVILQIAVGAGLILNGRYDIKNDKDIYRANKVNNCTVIGIFIVTVVNVFISAFGVADPVG